jgi:hypothetical protein
MTPNHRFGSDCDQGSARLSWRACGAIAPVFAVAGLALMGATAIACRATIVSIVPVTAAVYAGVGLPVNLSGLSIANLHVTVTQQTEGPGELLVTGEIENLSDGKTSVPDLRLALRGEDGREIYVWTTKGPKTSLNARERIPFRARLAAPPAGVREVLVKFDAPGDKGGLFTESPS